MRNLYLTAASGAVVLVTATSLVAQTPNRAGNGAPRGEQIAATACASCHGATGDSPDVRYPKLAGQNPEYLYRQLWAYKNGARPSDVMAPIAASLSDRDMAALADFFSRQAARPDALKDARLAARGQRDFFQGAVTPMGMTPPCAQCHAPSGAGRMPMMGGMMGHMGMMGMMGMRADIPGLKGQHAAYIVDQLNRFARGQRPSPVMDRIAAGLTETDKRAVAEFLATTP